MARRKLNDEEKDSIANKEWKKTPIFTSDEKVAYKAKNLTGPKTVEGKKKALANLQVGRNTGDNGDMRKHGGYVHKILNEDELELYNARRSVYERDYDINESADEIILHTALMEEVKYYRLQKYQAEHPTEDLDRAVNDCTRRLRTALEDLGALRKQRLKQDEKVASLNIATIAQQFAREMMQGNVDDELRRLREEEEQFLIDKKTSDINDRYVINDEEVVEDDREE
jgi:hypothetical protein